MAARKKVQEGKRDDLFVVAGSDDGQVRDEAHRWFHELAGENADEFGCEMIEGTADNAENAFQICRRTIEALQTLPFFGSKVVWLKGVDFMADTVTGRAERTLDGVEMLRATVEAGLSPGIKFLLSAGTVDKRRGFWKLLEKSAQVRMFDKIDTSRDNWRELVGGVVAQRAADLGFSFEPEALELFVMLAGEATQQIRNELEKLDLYLGERRLVTVQDVRAMVPLSRAGAVFEIGNAIQHGDIARALELVDQQLAQGENPVGLMRASVIPTVRNMFVVSLLMAGRRLPTGNGGAFAAALDSLPEPERSLVPRKKDGTPNVWPLFFAAKGLAASGGAGRMRAAFEACARADRELVSTGIDPRLVLQRLITSLAPPPRRAAAAGAGQ
jgi:DNA polymerase-3 subunit delta